MHILKNNEIPSQLSEIPQPPKNLWIEGTLPGENNFFITIVGSRKCSTYGKDAVEKIIKELEGYPIVIVSGLALGIDTHAHRCALKYNIKTIAFPGSGLNNEVLYPRNNWHLAKEIIEKGGALISELPPDTKAQEWTFPRRNRLMAGISALTIIVEAEEKSGTQITARLALDYNKEVGAVPGSIFSDVSFLPNKLIKEGAYPITNGIDVLHILGIAIKNEKEEILYTEEEKNILDQITDTINKDDLIELLNLPIHEANSKIALLEIKGYIKEEGGMIRKI